MSDVEEKVLALHWRPTSEWQDFSPATRPDLADAIRKVWGPFPVELDMHDLPVLKAMAVVGGASFGNLVKLIGEHGRIVLDLR